MSMALSPTPVTITAGPSVPPPSSALPFQFTTAFVTSLTGILTASEMILSIIVYALSVSSAGGISSLQLLMALSFSYWLQCFFFLLSESTSTRPVLPGTSYFLTFHALGSLLYIFVSIAHLASFNSSATVAGFSIAGQALNIDVFNADVVNAAGAMGLIAGAAHLFHVALIVRKMIS
ncbi:uncharacterized protein [Dermacentor andersoni]|uniref:uncharacterized protein n=1 Tax=Dermacentor andersoni TaxID=34620 RepID=UPI0021554F0B|nr:uncharacterized protein LOC126544866 [Dermacentor andersoni]XP_050048355.1 uncharacterized protein LOC126544866 [Dermacentor andersoni]